MAFDECDIVWLSKFKQVELLVVIAGSLLTLALTAYHVFIPFYSTESEAFPTQDEQMKRVKVLVISSYGSWAAYAGLLVFAIRVPRD